MKNFLLANLFTILIAACPAYGQTQDDVPLFKTQNEGRVLAYSISQGRANRLPKWDLAQPTIPLQIHEAVAKAQAWVKKKNPKIESLIPNRIDLGRVSYGRFLGLWYYEVGFDGVVGGQRLYGWGLQAVVLMDGSIVEPQLEK